MDFPSASYDAWKTTPPEDEVEAPEDRWGYDPEQDVADVEPDEGYDPYCPHGCHLELDACATCDGDDL